MIEDSKVDIDLEETAKDQVISDPEEVIKKNLFIANEFGRRREVQGKVAETAEKLRAHHIDILNYIMSHKSEPDVVETTLKLKANQGLQLDGFIKFLEKEFPDKDQRPADLKEVLRLAYVALRARET